MPSIPGWHVKGDWFDVCNCNIPCPCTFAQPPTFGECDGVLAFHIREGRYGSVRLNGLNLVLVGYYKGNIWAGAKATMGIFLMNAPMDSSARLCRQSSAGRPADGQASLPRASPKYGAWN